MKKRRQTFGTAGLDRAEDSAIQGQLCIIGCIVERKFSPTGTVVNSTKLQPLRETMSKTLRKTLRKRISLCV